MSSKAKTLARRLLREHRHKRSWRVIAREDFHDEVNHATLNRIALSGGDWLPKDKRILLTLGLIHERKPKPQPKPFHISDPSSYKRAFRLTIDDFNPFLRKEKRTRK